MYNAYRIVVDVAKVETEKLNELMEAISDAVDNWMTQFPDRNWDEFIHGHGFYDEIMPGAFKVGDTVRVIDEDLTGKIVSVHDDSESALPYYVSLEGVTGTVPYGGDELERVDEGE